MPWGRIRSSGRSIRSRIGTSRTSSRPYWGGTYNGEMKRLMLRHAFTFVDHVVFLIGPENWRSRRAIEKIGGVLVEARVNSAGLPCVVYRITASSRL
jgi:RimJ/RimL family protein N-acetyltransferase